MIRGAIDIGNSRHKTGLFDSNGTLLETAIFDDLPNALEWLVTKGAEETIISDVRGNNLEVDFPINIIYVTPDLKLPFRNRYRTPETLGADRLAAMAAVAVLYPGKASLVFDIGTCMTIDLLSPSNEYFGGNISPGLQMRLKAMEFYTGKLPLASLGNINLPMGNDTMSALANGAIVGMKNEIEGYIASTLAQFPDANVVLCGGDAHYFDKQLKYKIFANQNLVLFGLYQLLVFND